MLPVRIDPTGRTGPTRGQARAKRWRRTSSGCYVPDHVDASRPVQRIAEAVPLLPPGGAVTGWASLHLQMVAFLDGVRADGCTPRDVLLVTGPRQRRRPRDGIRFLQDRLDDVILVRGVPCTPVRRALFDEMRFSGSLEDAVVAMDMTAAAGAVSISRMRRYAETHAGWDGVRLVREALDLADEDSKSPQETRYRMVWQCEAGLSRPLVNQPIFSRAGRLLGYPDLLDVDAGLVGEYDGADHRTASRHSKDVGREDLFRRCGLEVTRATSYDLRDRPALTHRILDARRRATARPRGEGTWTLEPPPWFRPELPLDVRLDLRGEPD